MFEKYKNRKDYIALAILAILNVATHLQWLFNFRIFSSGDWWYISPEKYRDFATFSPIWYSDGFGGTSATPSFYLVRFFEGLMSQIGASFITNEKLFFFIPIIMGASFGTYIFLRQYFSQIHSFVGSVVFSFNTALLFNYAGALTIAVVDALTPITLFFFMQYLQKPKSKKLLAATALSFAIIAAYELRITIIVLAIAGGYFLYRSFTVENSRRYVLERLLPLAKLGSLFLLLQAFWILPYIINSRSGVTFSDALSQGLFVSFSDMSNALTLHHPFWTNGRPATFVIQSIPLYAWLIPVMAFAGFVMTRNKGRAGDIPFWIFTAIAGLFLVKQVNAPFDGTYPWIFSNVPGFAAYREASKFYLLISLAYAVLIPYTLVVIRERLAGSTHIKKMRLLSPKRIYIASICVVLAVFLVNAVPLVTGKFRTLYAPRSIPQDYVKFNAFINEQSEFFRILWLPVNSRWVSQSTIHPSIAATNIKQGYWLTNLANGGLPQEATLKDRTLNIFAHQSSNDMLDTSSIKYVAVPTRDVENEDDFHYYYGNDRDYYVQWLGRQPYLKRIDIGTKDLAVYENMDYRPLASASASLQGIDFTPESNIDNLQQLITKQLRSQLNFVDTSKTKPEKTPPKVTIKDIFQDMRPETFKDGAVEQVFKTGAEPRLYHNTNNAEYQYEIKNGTLSIIRVLQKSPVRQGNAVLVEGREETPVSSIAIDKKEKYAIETDNGIQDVNPKEAARSLGVQKKNLAIYKVNKKNLVQDGSFEIGGTNAQIKHCSQIDQTSRIANSEDYSTTGSKSLKMTTQDKPACVSAKVNAASEKDLQLNLSYLAIGTQKVRYDIIYNDPAKTKVSQELFSKSRWQTLQTVLHTPKGATNFTFTLTALPDYMHRGTGFTYFDNLQFVTLEQLTKVPINQATSFQSIDLPANSQITLRRAKDEASQGKNLIANGSFDKGPWQKQVGDCNNYDDRASLGMKLFDSEHGKAIQLTARRHSACTSYNDVPVSGNSSYLLSFKYQSPNAKTAAYSIRYNDPNNTEETGTIKIKNKNWGDFEKQLTAPVNASRVNVIIYAYGDSNGEKTYINNYDEFKLQELPALRNMYYLVDGARSNIESPPQVAYTMHGSTKTHIEIKRIKEPTYLTISQTYNPLWILSTDVQKGASVNSLLPKRPAGEVKADYHYVANDYLNGWYIDPEEICAQPTTCEKNADGSYNIKLVAEFVPQRWVYVGSFVSVLALIGVAIHFVSFKSRNSGGVFSKAYNINSKRERSWKR